MVHVLEILKCKHTGFLQGRSCMYMKGSCLVPYNYRWQHQMQSVMFSCSFRHLAVFQ